MAEGIERAEELLRSAVGDDAADRAELTAHLETLPEKQTGSLLESVAREQGVVAVPLLEQLAATSKGAVALAATQALGTLRNETAATSLRRVSDATSDRHVRKAARRELHKLATLGITARAAGAAPRLARGAPSPAYMTLASPIDGLGNRAIWFGFRSGPDLQLLSLLVNDGMGIKDTFFQELALSRFERQVRDLTQDQEMPWIELPVDYCRQLVEEAHAINAVSRTPLPMEYMAWRERIGPPERRYEQPLIYDVINAAEIRWDPRYLDSSDHLFNLEMFRIWVLDREEMAEYAREIMVGQQSGLLLAGRDPEASRRLVEDRAIQKLFDSRRRPLYRRRLEEMAYLLWKLDRTLQARQALAAAMALEPPDRSLLDHPFVRALVRLSLDVLVVEAREERIKEVKPGVQLHLPY